MPRTPPSRSCAACFAAAMLLTTGSAVAQMRAIPPGQEALVATMLGSRATFPAGCRLTGAEIRATAIRARYACDAGRSPTLELRDVEGSPEGSLRAGPFAITTPDGPAPDGLTDAVAALVRANAGAWRWQTLGGRTPPPAISTFDGRLFNGPLAVLLLVLLAVAVGRRRAPRDLAAALAVMAVTALVLRARHVGVPLHPDTVRDMLYARDCVDARACHALGPPASFAGLTHGTSWLRLLEFVGRRGFGPDGARTAVDLLATLAAGVVFLAARRRAATGLAALAGVAFVVTSAQASGRPLLWNPSALSLPTAIFFALASSAAATGATATWVAAAAALAFSVDLHVASGALIPPFVAALVAWSHTPRRAIPLAVVSLLGTLALLSHVTLARNLAVAGRHWEFLLALALSIAVGAAARRRALALAEGPRVALALTTLVVPFALALALASAPSRPFANRYLLPMLPGLALLVAIALDAFAARVAAITRRPAAQSPIAWALAAATIAVVLTRPGAPVPRGWQLGELRPLATHLDARGWRWPDLYVHLQGPGNWALLSGLGVFQRDVRTSGRDDDVVIVRAPRASLPPSIPPRWDVATIGPGMVAVVRSLPSFIDRSRVRACLAHDCVEVDPAAEAHEPGMGPFIRRAYLSWSAAARRFARGGPARDGAGPSYEFAVRVPGGGAPHEFALCASAGWRIEGVAGDLTATVAGPHRVVIDGASAGRGRIILSLESGANTNGWPPEMLETDDDDDGLRRLIRATDDRRCRW